LWEIASIFHRNSRFVENRLSKLKTTYRQQGLPNAFTIISTYIDNASTEKYFAKYNSFEI